MDGRFFVKFSTAVQRNNCKMLLMSANDPLRLSLANNAIELNQANEHSDECEGMEFV